MKKVLVVDDNPNILEAVELILSSENYEVKTLLQGDETHQTVLSFHPDVVILDLLLSGKDGREITKELKADPLTKATPVIIISAHPSAKKAAESAGADEFLEKPFDVKDLLATVNKVIH